MSGTDSLAKHRWPARPGLRSAAVLVAFLAAAVGVALGFFTSQEWATPALISLFGLTILLRLEIAYRRNARRDRQLARRAAATGDAVRTLTSLAASNAQLLDKFDHRLRGLSAGEAVRDSLLAGGPLDVRLRRELEQFQATINLFDRVQVRGLVPPMRGWAASPDVLNLLVDELITGRPNVVVECGSGVSTLWLALAAEQYDVDCRIVSLDHDAEFLAATHETLRRNGVAHRVDLRLAPLVPTRLSGHGTHWYDELALADVVDIGLVFIDGPPDRTGPLSRFPAVPLLYPRLAQDAVIVLDDAARPDEASAVARWAHEFPDLTLRLLPMEKGAAVLRRSAAR